MLIYPNAKESGLINMAKDWLLYEKAELPSFRHYQWSSVETSFGYGQDWKWVEKITDHPIDKLIRRPTGGGIVKHGEDWTYCLVIPSVHHAFSMPPLDLYKEVHLCISSALAKQDLMTTLQPCPKEKGKIIPGDCFEEPVGWDLMNFGSSTKVAGAAMKRSRKGVLLQGTIIMDKSWKLKREKFQESLIHLISEMLKETTDQVDWPNNNSPEIEKVYNQFASLEWKKNRIRN
jgi:lipoate-protein ligase A